MGRFGEWVTRLVDEASTVETKRARVYKIRGDAYVVENKSRPRVGRSTEETYRSWKADQ